MVLVMRLWVALFEGPIVVIVAVIVPTHIFLGNRKCHGLG
jgi:hypothetical protein